MVATVDYQWIRVQYFLVNDLITEDAPMPAVAALTGGGYFTAWQKPQTSDGIEGRVILRSDGSDAGSEFAVNSTTAGLQLDASVAGLTNGNAVVTFTDYSVDPGGDIRARIFDRNGTALALDFPVESGTTRDNRSDVAALADGGFVVTWTRDFDGLDDLDIVHQRFNADGSPRDTATSVQADRSLATSDSQVAVLSGGGF